MLSLLLFAELVIASLRRRKYSLALSILLLLRFLIIRELNVDGFFFVVLNVIEFLVISDDGPACGCCCCSVSRGMLTATRQKCVICG